MRIEARHSRNTNVNRLRPSSVWRTGFGMIIILGDAPANLCKSNLPPPYRDNQLI